ncbi:MAG: hypothetical protein GF332_04180 [Candidatus Moranbacteria bacterium]|nr:hypothetical protein [Candidatus Moranbacteria bacterium]
MTIGENYINKSKTNKKIIKIKFLIFALFFILAFFGLFNKEVSAAIWDYEGKMFYSFQSQQPNTVPVYRFWSESLGGHFYTASKEEKSIVEQKWGDIWRLEGVNYYVYPKHQTGTVPVYRFWSPVYSRHFYTASEQEKNTVIKQWSNIWHLEGIIFYVYPRYKTGTTAIHRFWSPVYSSHFYTASEKEKNLVIEKWGSDPNSNQEQSLGPEIRVGILGYDKSYSKDHSMRITANKDYVIKDKDGRLIATINKDERTKVKYDGDGKLRVYDSIDEILLDQDVNFEAKDGNHENMIFHVEPKNFDDYRGRIQIHYTGSPHKQVWAINILPLEHYTWGMGEITGTGPMEYNKLMTIIYRTYGYKKKISGVINQEKGFDIDTTAGNQIYYGYDWEVDHPRIREGAEKTWGKMVLYDNEPVWTPYSSSTDGRTRSWQEVWGGTNHPYCQSVSDPWGKVPNAGSIPGNHMVGVSATGALNQAKDGEDYDDILEHYYTDIEIKEMY